MSHKVTILLATYNRAHLIIETLQSIQNQTYTNWECIIVDDYSIDNSKEIIERFIKNDNRFSYFLKEEKYSKGLSGSRNQGLDLAVSINANFIQFFDDDDIMHPRKLELQMEEFIKDSSLDMTLCMYRKFHIKNTIDFNLETSNDNSCKITSNNLFEDFLFNKINLNSPGPIWKISSIKNYKFDESLNYAEEKDFYLRIFLKKNIIYEPINYVLFWYRKHDKAITSNFYDNQEIKTKAELLVRRKISLMILKERKISLALLKFLLKSILKR
jgi:GalNAc5-diNAcBac-PP-undecaprenol beta-1,3-glucosyltransferase